MRRFVLRTLSVVAGVTAILAGTQVAAQAETRGGTNTYQDVQQNTSYGYCRADVMLNSSHYVRALYYDDHAGWNCTMWLERSANYGATWYRIQGPTTLYNLSSGDADLARTDYYADDGGYLARACFHLNFAGAAKHCTNAL